MLKYIKIAVVALIIGILGAYHLNAIEDAKDEVNKRWENAQLIKDIEQGQKEKTILDKSLELEREKNVEITKLTATVERLRYSLRNRPSRETIVYNNDSSAPQACTGRELSREDGEFLAGEAARAEKLIKERDFYYQQYEQVRKNLHE